MRPHWMFLFGPSALTLVAVAGAVAVMNEFPRAPSTVAWVLLAMVAVPAAWLAVRTARWLGTSLVVTSGRLLLRRGVLGRDLVQLRLERINEVHCTQTLVDRLVGAGRLMVEVGGEAGMVVIDDVRRPRVLQRVLNGQLGSLRWNGSSDVPVPPHVREEGSLAPTLPHPWGGDPTPPHGVAAVPRSSAHDASWGRTGLATTGAAVGDPFERPHPHSDAAGEEPLGRRRPDGSSRPLHPRAADPTRRPAPPGDPDRRRVRGEEGRAPSPALTVCEDPSGRSSAAPGYRGRRGSRPLPVHRLWQPDQVRRHRHQADEGLPPLLRRRRAHRRRGGGVVRIGRPGLVPVVWARPCRGGPRSRGPTGA